MSEDRDRDRECRRVAFQLNQSMCFFQGAGSPLPMPPQPTPPRGRDDVFQMHACELTGHPAARPVSAQAARD